MKCTDFKCYSLMNFDRCIWLYNPNPIVIQNISITLKSFLVLPVNPPPPIPIQRQPVFWFLLRRFVLPGLEPHRNGIIPYESLCLASCAQHESLEICQAVMYISSCFALLSSVHRMDILQFVYPFSWSSTFDLFPYFGYYAWTFMVKCLWIFVFTFLG